MARTGQKQYQAAKDAHDARKRHVLIPAPEDYQRRLDLEADPGAWLRHYAGSAFPLPWAEFHLLSIARLQSAIEHGGSYALAFPRGSGKTTLSRWMMVWAILSGHKRYGLLVCATGKKAEQMIDTIKFELRHNAELAADYPEICAPIQALEGISMRVRAQTYGAANTKRREPTHCDISAGVLALPTTDRWDGTQWVENPAKGAVIEACGITGDVRGRNRTMFDGSIVRPDISICDDPQTRESAKSPQQTTFRLGVITEDIAGSDGPSSAQMSIIVPCTIIRPNDLADQLLNNENYPDFRGEKCGILNKLPDDLEPWDEWNKVRVQGLRDDDASKASNEYYEANRETLDGDLHATWPARTQGCVSAIQYAMQQYYKLKRGGFLAEYMNEPEFVGSSMYAIDVHTVAGRTNGLKRGEFDDDDLYLCAGVDVNFYALSWAVVGVTKNCAVSVADYGFYPGGTRNLWDSDSNVSEDRAIHNGILQLVDMLCKRYPKLTMVGVDGNYKTDTVYSAVKVANRKRSTNVLAVRGVASQTYGDPRSKKLVMRRGVQCHHSRGTRGPHVVFNSHYWHRAQQSGFLLTPGQPGSVSLFGSDGDVHGELARHICADKLVSIDATTGKELYLWDKAPREKNDLSDAVVMGMACASALGARTNEDRPKDDEDDEPRGIIAL